MSYSPSSGGYPEQSLLQSQLTTLQAAFDAQQQELQALKSLVFGQAANASCVAAIYAELKNLGTRVSAVEHAGEVRAVANVDVVATDRSKDGDGVVLSEATFHAVVPRQSRPQQLEAEDGFGEELQRGSRSADSSFKDKTSPRLVDVAPSRAGPGTTSTSSSSGAPRDEKAEDARAENWQPSRTSGSASPEPLVNHPNPRRRKSSPTAQHSRTARDGRGASRSTSPPDQLSAVGSDVTPPLAKRTDGSRTVESASSTGHADRATGRGPGTTTTIGGPNKVSAREEQKPLGSGTGGAKTTVPPGSGTGGATTVLPGAAARGARLSKTSSPPTAPDRPERPAGPAPTGGTARRQRSSTTLEKTRSSKNGSDHVVLPTTTRSAEEKEPLPQFNGAPGPSGSSTNSGRTSSNPFDAYRDAVPERVYQPVVIGVSPGGSSSAAPPPPAFGFPDGGGPQAHSQGLSPRDPPLPRFSNVAGRRG